MRSALSPYLSYRVIKENGNANGPSVTARLIYARSNEAIKCTRLDFSGVSRRRFQFDHAIMNIKAHYRERGFTSEIEDLVTTGERRAIILFFDEDSRYPRKEKWFQGSRARRQPRRIP